MAMAWLAIALAGLPLFLQFLLAVLVGWRGWLAIRAARHPPVTGIVCNKACWRLHTADEIVEVVIAPGWFSGFGLLGLSFRSLTGERRRLLLWPDSVDAENLRQLRLLWLAMQRGDQPSLTS